MTATYPAMLLNGRLTWQGDNPPQVPVNKEVLVSVTITEDTDRQARGKALKEALDAIAASGIVTEEFYQEWLESRKSKPLHGREE
jgi:hypothetical protein